MYLRSVLGVILLMAMPAVSQQKPFTATQTHTRDVISPDGRVTDRLLTRKHYFVASSGSILIQDLTPDNIPTRGQLLDYGHSKKAYAIDYVDADAQEERPLGRLPGLVQNRAVAPNGLTEKVLQGFQCFDAPIFQQLANGGKELIGQACLAPSLNFLPIRENSTTKLPDGRRVHVVIELSNVRLGSEPDPALFATDSASIKRARNLGR